MGLAWSHEETISFAGSGPARVSGVPGILKSRPLRKVYLPRPVDDHTW